MSDNNRSKKTGAAQRSGAKSQTSSKPRKKPELTEEQLQMVMPKRKHSQVFDDVIAILIIALGIFLIISLQTKTAGPVGDFIGRLLFGLFGIIAYVIPYFLIIYGILIFARKALYISTRTFICSLVIFILLAALNASRFDPIEGKFLASIAEVYKAGPESGGVCGMLVARLIFSFASKPVLYLICGVGILIMLILIINTPISELYAKMRLRMAAKKLQREAEAKVREQERAEQLEEEKKRKAVEEAEKSAMAREAMNKAMAEAEQRQEAEAQIELNPVTYGEDEQESSDQPQTRFIEPPVNGIRSADEPLDTSSLHNFKVADLFHRVDEDKTPTEPEEAGPVENKPVEEPERTISPLAQSAEFSDTQKNILGYVFDDKLYGLKIPYKDEENEKQPEPQPLTEPAPEPVVSEQPQAPVQTTAAPARKPTQKGYVYPPLNLLKKPDGTKGQTGQVQIGEMSRILENTLRSFGVNASVINVVQGPAVTRFDVQPATGVKVSSIVKLKDDIALNLRARSLRIEAPIPGQAAVGIEVANENVNTVLLREIIDTKEFKNHKSKVAIALGRAISGDPIIANIKDMPHLLIAGTTGSGKSVCINDILISLLYKASPEEVKLLLIDPKVVELSNFNGIPHLLAPVVTEPNKASAILAWAVSEMNERYQRFASEGVREIESYNETVIANEEPEKALPKIVIVIDELADLIMMSKNAVESNICMLAQKARAAGMYLIIATQRPSTNVITGVIKANIPSKIAFAVNSHIDSQVILDMTGAESLLGRGDMLYLPQSMGKPVRVQGCYVSDQEVNAVIDFVKTHNTAQNDFSEDAMAAIERAGSAAAGDEESDEADDLLAQCIEFAVTNETCSVSILQRKFRIGYNRAARLVDMMEERGILGSADGQKPRKVLLNAEEFARLKRAAESAAMDESES